MQQILPLSALNIRNFNHVSKITMHICEIRALKVWLNFFFSKGLDLLYAHTHTHNISRHTVVCRAAQEAGA